MLEIVIFILVGFFASLYVGFLFGKKAEDAALVKLDIARHALLMASVRLSEYAEGEGKKLRDFIDSELRKIVPPKP